MMGSGSQVPADFVVQFGTVQSSSIREEPDTGEKVGVCFAVEGAGEVGGRGEVEQEADVFGALGIIGRPLPPSTVRGRKLHAEVLCLRTADGLVPISARDLRLRMQGNGPAEGTLAFLGYGGGFHSLSPVDGDPTKGTIHVVYCPYDFDSDGVAQKAHVITLDPTSGNESVTIVHADGMAITMSAADKKALVMKNAAGDATLRLDDDGITLTAKTIVLSGGVILGEPALAVPFAGGPAMPPCSKFFYSTP